MEFGRIEVRPNTAVAHKLVAWSAANGAEAQQAALIESLFTAYFMDGEDIGDLSVLQRRALECGLEHDGVLGHMAVLSTGTARTCGISRNGIQHQRGAVLCI
jgi:predicted DsbA family dithiol-disulfide isomerase